MGHFTIVSLVTRTSIGSEAGGDLQCFSYVDHVVLMQTTCSLHLHMKSTPVCIKTRSPLASLPIKGQVTKHTTVKWPINCPL